MREWSAEVSVDAPLARRLIAGQFPELVDASLRPLGVGWDNTVWLVDERWAFRFPRRELAVPGVRREIAVLPRLAARLPLPVPVPRFAGEPAEGYPWPFFGAPFLPGREIAGLGEDARARLGRPLGEFLRALHDQDAGDLPEDPFGRADMAKRAPMARERLAAVGREAPVFLADARELGPAPPTALLHGDLHVRHLLVHEDGSPAAVIDWGDVCRGDPSVDLSLYWSLLPPAGRDAFLAAYGPVSDEQLLRARVLALMLNAILAAYAREEGMAALEAEALAGLDRTMDLGRGPDGAPPRRA